MLMNLSNIYLFLRFVYHSANCSKIIGNSTELTLLQNGKARSIHTFTQFSRLKWSQMDNPQR